ncbi:MAG TPA: pentapeptide repeat-containing protein [Ktedonobacteraceae bacterium]|jgi:uncharacterized protein YjbI with pentapeptide repeats
MLANREALIARWETDEGKILAREALQVLRSPAGARPGPIRPLDTAFLQRLQTLPFVEEIAPQIDLRGLHLEGKLLGLEERDLAGVRLDYAFPLHFISNCRVNGAIFDYTFSVYGSFLRADLQGISLVGASLRGGSFTRADLREANLQGTRLALADLAQANCTRANFSGADMRFSDMHDANVCGADLREADFTESNLGDVIFDTRTLVQGANFKGTLVSDDFRAFAQQAGALLNEGQTYSARELARFDAALTHVRRNNLDGHLDRAIVLMQAEREKFALDPDYPYYEGIDDAFARVGLTPLINEVMELWEDASKALAHFL